VLSTCRPQTPPAWQALPRAEPRPKQLTLYRTLRTRATGCAKPSSASACLAPHAWRLWMPRLDPARPPSPTWPAGLQGGVSERGLRPAPKEIMSQARPASCLALDTQAPASPACQSGPQPALVGTLHRRAHRGAGRLLLGALGCSGRRVARRAGGAAAWPGAEPHAQPGRC